MPACQLGIDRGVGLIFLAGFGAVASGTTASWAVIAITVAVVVSFRLTALAVELYRQTRIDPMT